MGYKRTVRRKYKRSNKRARDNDVGRGSGWKKPKVGSKPGNRPKPAQEAQGDNSINDFNITLGAVIYSRTKLVGAPINHCWNQQTVMVGLEGRQAVDTIMSIGTRTQWITSSGTGAGHTEAFRRFHDLNPNQATSGGGFYDLIDSPGNSELCLKKTRIVLELTNLQNVPVTGQIYVHKCKQNTADNPQGYWVAGFGDGALAPLGASAFPAATVTTDLFTASSVNVPNMPLYNTRECKTFWKEVSKINYEIAAGGRIRMQYFAEMNMVSELATESTNAALAFRKGSLVFTAVACGHPVLSGVGTDSMVYPVTKIGVTASIFTTFFATAEHIMNPVSTFTTNYKMNASNAITTELIIDADTNLESNVIEAAG